MGHLRRTVLFASAFVACTLVGCKGDSPAPPEPCFGCGPSPVGPGGDTQISADNRTDHSVTITVRETHSLIIDRKVLDGSLSVPIGPARSGADRAFIVEPAGTAFLSRPISVLNGAQMVPSSGVIVRVGDAPLVLAVGSGALVVRSRDGADVLEADDPRSLTLLPVDRELAECAPGVFGDLLPEMPSSLAAGKTAEVVSMRRDGACRVFTFDGFVEYRACMPDAAFPFADSDVLTASPLDSGGVRLSNGDGVFLYLHRVRFHAHVTLNVGGVAVAYSEHAECASISAFCGDVDLPAKVRVSFDGQAAETLAVGASYVDPRNATRTLFFVGARARPVFAQSCLARPDQFAAEVALAVVEKPAP